MSASRRRWAAAPVALAAAAVAAPRLAAQVTTTATLAGRVTTTGAAAAGPPPAAQVIAVHRPSGTTYRATARADGRFVIPGMRVGGPYAVTVRALGYAPFTRDDIVLQLGTQADLAVALSPTAARLSAVTVEAAPTGTLSAARTGAATSVGRAALQTLPTISRTIGDFVRLTPQAVVSGSQLSFAGQDTRYNNILVDGASFNNSFGLQGQPGARTGVAPIPIDAIDQIQVNIAPYDVRQGSFTGASVNTVTRSGTNNLEGSAYFYTRNQSYVGTVANGLAYNPGTFKFGQFGARLGGPVLQNRLFFFANYETDRLTQPGTSFVPNAGGQSVGGNVTRVLQGDVTQLQQFLQSKFNYNTGPVTGYNFATPSDRLLAKLDFNADDHNKLSLRYTLLNSSADFPESNSNSLGFGNRQGTINALSFANSGYTINENIRSLVGEWNSQIGGGRMANNVIAGYTTNDESRSYKGALFPTVDVLDPTTQTTYLAFGFEPFTPDNQLRYKTLQAQDNFSVFTDRHDLTFGAAYERFRSENVFFPGSQSVYVYNSLGDFYADAQGYLDNPGRTTSAVPVRLFQLRYNNIPGQTEPLQPLKVNSYSAYAQDVWRAARGLQLTLGLRADVPVFSPTGFTNPQANALTFRDEHGDAVRYQTQKLPDANLLFSPRLGFNWDVTSDRSTQLRGGTGVFSGRPAYVWISNQVGQNGIQTGFQQLANTSARPFNPNPTAYAPATVTGAPAATYEVDYTDKGFRFPQQWRSNLAVDQRLPFGVVGTAEVLYGRDVNGVYYINANLPAPPSAFTGPDARPRWLSATPGVDATRLNPNITAAYVLKNESVGYNYNLSGSLEKSFRNGLFAKAGYNYGVSKNTVDAGSIASGSFTGNAISGNPNNAPLANSAYYPGSRFFAALAYRREYFHFGATTLSLFAENITSGVASYTIAGDMNGDGATGNDLVYIPRNRTETNFVAIAATSTRPGFTVQQQQDAWAAFINQDGYLSKHRGQYAERNAVILPKVFRADASVAQEIFRPGLGKRNSVQVRLDAFNVGNLINSRYGVGRRLVTTQPLAYAGADANGGPLYRLAVVNNQLISASTQGSASVTDVYRLQLSLRYSFQ
ncbi:cell envelope biogenesis protein OmpA [Gemmatimonadetes bacterium T265]|nr:cell envelope biogenesis protein OmpA [Gemmatimonadetes bacterium T265]